MIELFHIPTHKIDTGKFKHILHDPIVREFEDKFADYVGAKYAVSFNSATSAIFLYLLSLNRNRLELTIPLPSLIPPVVPNACLNAGHKITFVDSTEWVGHAYDLFQFPSGKKVIDSAQALCSGQYESKHASTNDIMIFSFYPTKPLSGKDGGMIVGNIKSEIEELRDLMFNGMTQELNNWERGQTCIGHKMYMDSVQAWIVNENFKNLECKKMILASVREWYNKSLELNNNSEHLYRIRVSNNKGFIKKALKAGIRCGIHYEATHLNPLFEYSGLPLYNSVLDGVQMVSIPYHEKLTKSEIRKVVEFVKKNR